jgi:hypothetical protein
MLLIGFNSSTRKYVSRDNAIKAAEKACPGLDRNVRVVINTDGRQFSPVFVLNRESMHLAQPLAAQGFQVLG